jgi:outer membrane protein
MSATRLLRSARIGGICICTLLVTLGAHADSDVTVLKRGLLPERDGRWGLGVGLRLETSPYKEQPPIRDLLPILSYEGDRAYLRGTRAGLRLIDGTGFKLEAIGQFRLTGYRGADGSLLDGMSRARSFDVGLTATVPTRLGDFTVEALTDVSNAHEGEELSIGWGRTWESGRLRWRPTVSLNRYSKDLANYYFGVRPDEVRPDRPAYTLSPSTNVRFALDAVYPITTNGYLYGSVGVNYFDDEIGSSPIVVGRTQWNTFVGYLYRFGNGSANGESAALGALEKTRWSVRVARGWNAEASLLDIVPGGDLSLSPERTGVFNVEVGKLLDERFNGWPVDIWVKGSYTRYLEQGLQPDFNGYQLYIKGFYYLPWSKWVKTRFGLGEGLSWAEEIPYLEAQSIESKNPNTSRLLNYLDVSIDVSIGDLIRWNKLKDTYLGFVVIHRSGVFGWSDIFGGVDGGSNYNSVYIETVF